MRMNRESRRALIVATGVRIANQSGLQAATWWSIALQSSVPIAARTVRHHYPTQRDLWSAISRADGVEPSVVKQAADLGVA